MNALIVPMPMTGPAQAARVTSSLTLSAIKSTRLRPGSDGGAVNADRSVPTGRRRVTGQPGGYLVDDHRVLVALVFDIGEYVEKQLAAAEFGQGPPEGVDARSPAGRPAAAQSGRRELDGAKKPTDLNGWASQPEAGVGSPQVVVEASVRLVEEQQVFALDREHERLRVDCPSAELPRGEQRVQEEQSEACLGGDPGNAGDRNVGTPGAIEEVEVDVDRLAVAAQPDRDLARHLVEVERAVAVTAGRAGRRTARQRRHVAFGLHARRGYLCQLLDVGKTPSEMRKTSEPNDAPSCRARTCVTMPAVLTGPTPGTSRTVSTMSSS